MADALGDVVGHWITHNEPWGVAFLGPRRGHEGARPARLADRAAGLAPPAGLARPRRPGAAREPPPDATVGISLNLAPVRAASSSQADVEAARRRGRPRQPLVPGPAAPRRLPRRPGRALRATRRARSRSTPGTWRRSRRRSTSSASTTTTRPGAGRPRRRAARPRACPAAPAHQPAGLADRSAGPARAARAARARLRPAADLDHRERHPGGPRSTTTRASRTSLPTWKRSARRSRTAPTSGGTSSGPSWTASNGSSGTARASASCTSTSRRSAARSSAAHAGTATG